MKIATLLIFSLILFSCKEKANETELSIAMSRPFYCPTDGAKIIFFSKGELVSLASTLTDIGEFGWAYPQNAVTYSRINKLPDSLAVDYGGLNTKLEMCTYKGGKKLPIAKMQELLKNGYSENNNKTFYRNIIVGLAPGGRICVWMDHVELLRFKVPEIDVYFKTPIMHFGDSIDIMEYLKKHPINYNMWEKPNSRYELDFGFCNENTKVSFFVMYCLSKEGIRDVITENEIDITQWNIPFGKKSKNYIYSGYQQLNETKRDHKMCLPVDIQLSWENKENILYDTHVIMPNNLPQQYTKAYLNPETGETTNFNRIVFGVEKDGEHCVVWLDGPGKQEKIMRFKGQLALKDNNGVFIKRASYATEVTYY